MEKTAMAMSKQWTRVRMLGRGASGAEVFLAADDASGELFAVKSACADIARGLAYLHGESVVHGDVKARNVVLGADGRAKLADFGCARKAGLGPIIGGTPAFMAPEVARGEEQDPAADVWALGCTVLEMATGRAPWSAMDGDALAAMHRIGYSDAVPEVPQWLSAEAKDFLAMCLIRLPLVAAVLDTKLEAVAGKWVSPKSTLESAFWELSESDIEEADDELSQSTANRIKALACPASALPDWNSDEGWIDVLCAAPTEAQDAVAVPAEETTGLDNAMASEEETADSGVLGITIDSRDSSVLTVGVAGDGSVWAHNGHQPLEILVCHELVPCKLFCGRSMNAIDFAPAQILLSVPLFLCLLFFLFWTSSSPIVTRSVSKTLVAATLMDRNPAILPSCPPRRMPKPFLPPR
jgi:hypothetical protein